MGIFGLTSLTGLVTVSRMTALVHQTPRNASTVQYRSGEMWCRTRCRQDQHDFQTRALLGGFHLALAVLPVHSSPCAEVDEWVHMQLHEGAADPHVLHGGDLNVYIDIGGGASLNTN